MKRIVSLVIVFSMVFCACDREENGETVSNSGSGAAASNTVTESAVSGGAAREENGSEPSPNMTITMAKKDGPMLTEQVDQTQKGIELVYDPDFATCLTKGDDGNIYYFRYEKKKGGKLTFYRNNAIKVCETVLSEQYEKDGYYIEGFLKQGEEFWIQFTSYEKSKDILVPLQIRDGKWGNNIKTKLGLRVIYYKDCFYSFYPDQSTVDIIDRNGNKRRLEFEDKEKRATIQMIIDDKLYYIIEEIKEGGSEYIVMRCNMDGSNKEKLFWYSRVRSTSQSLKYCKLRMEGNFIYLFDPYCRFTLTRIPLYGGEVQKIAAVDWYDLAEDSIYYLDRTGKISRVDKDLKGSPEVIMSGNRCGIDNIPFLYADGHLMVEDYNAEEINMLFTIFELDDSDLIGDIGINYSNIYYWIAENGDVEDTMPSTGFREEYYEWYERALPIVEKNADEWD